MTADAAAQAAGAANLLIFHGDGRIEGRNTDSVGLAESLREDLGADALKGQVAVLLGAGGAARGAVLALDDAGRGEIRIAQSRSAAAPKRWPQRWRRRSRPSWSASTLEDWTKAAADAALVVNATSAGMKGTPPLDIDLDRAAERRPRSATSSTIRWKPSC